MNDKGVNEVWAVILEDGTVAWSRGGSSTGRKLMVYTSKPKAERALSNPWIKQIIPDRSKVTIELIYKMRRGPWIKFIYKGRRDSRK